MTNTQLQQLPHISTLFNDSTKQSSSLIFISIFLIVIFIISPMSNYYKTSIFMKIIILILLSYTFYLSILQTNQMRKSYANSKELTIQKQLNMNIICSYIFLLFIGLLIIFVIKTF
jgi:hypothetical protein